MNRETVAGGGLARDAPLLKSRDSGAAGKGVREWRRRTMGFRTSLEERGEPPGCPMKRGRATIRASSHSTPGEPVLTARSFSSDVTDTISARAPERQSARAPERQSARAPERQSARAPERQSARAPWCVRAAAGAPRHPAPGAADVMDRAEARRERDSRRLASGLRGPAAGPASSSRSLLYPASPDLIPLRRPGHRPTARRRILEIRYTEQA